ncbi:MAG TPA: Holliday junction branch migration protein RuvA [Bacteroidia bacterium]|nr:Holliday junction branch migration protein RuvA [Bacteroidia bacterium]
MYNHLTGRLVEKNPASVVIECHGVGYLVNISLNTYSKITEEENLRLLVHFQISEDAHTLYGFADEEERRLFRLLITVSGIGCNTARMMLSSMNVEEIENCIVSEDVHRLKSIKGIGEKTAQRAILELKSKLKKEGIQPSVLSHLKVKDEAMAALLTLGFSRNTIDKTLDSLLKKNPVSTVEDLIKQALKSL